MPNLSNAKKVAAKILESLPNEVTTEEILLAIHQRNKLDSTLEYAQLRKDTDKGEPRSVADSFYDVLGCLFPCVCIALTFIAMPFFFTVGEMIVKRPERTIRAGTIQSISINENPVRSDLVGNNGKVTRSHLIVETPDGNTLLIPNEAYSSVQLVDEFD